MRADSSPSPAAHRVRLPRAPQRWLGNVVHDLYSVAARPLPAPLESLMTSRSLGTSSQRHRPESTRRGSAIPSRHPCLPTEMPCPPHLAIHRCTFLKPLLPPLMRSDRVINVSSLGTGRLLRHEARGNLSLSILNLSHRRPHLSGSFHSSTPTSVSPVPLCHPRAIPADETTPKSSPRTWPAYRDRWLYHVVLPN